MTAVKHPAKFSPELLPVMARYVDGAKTILDPFAGTGRIGQIKQHLTVQPEAIAANEIEPAWQAEHFSNGADWSLCRDARNLAPWITDERIDAIVTSPAYGNRMADACHWAEGRKHSTYTSALRETLGDPQANLQPGNAGAMQWGDAYRQLHREAWAEAWRVLVPGGRLVLNIADHIRDDVPQRVPEWHVSALLGLGFVLLDWVDVSTPRYGFGANAEKRCPELVIAMAKPEAFGEAFPMRWRWYPHWIGAKALRPKGGLWDVCPEPQQLGLFAHPT